MNTRKHPRSGAVLATIPVACFSVIAIYPLFWMALQSFKTDMEFYQSQFSFPATVQLVNYATAWAKANFSRYYLNSLITTGASLALCVLACSMSAYALAKIRFFASSIVKYLFVAVTFLPGVLLLFPVYMVSGQLGILGTRAGLIGPYIAGQVPMANLILISAYRELPNELAESARMDGCGHFGIWWHIMMPLIRNSLAAIAILQFITYWNEYMWAMISIQKPALYTLTIGLADMASKVYTIGFAPLFAGMMMTTMPVIAVYALLQKQFVSAITAGAVKG